MKGVGLAVDCTMDKVSLVVAALLLSSVCLSFGADTLAGNQSLAGDQTIVSSGERFELGFFKPGKSSNSYLGIWFKKVSLHTVVWVANRDTPIASNVSAELKLVGGNLVLDLVPPSKTPIWSTNLKPATTFSTVVAVLQDDGNFVLRNGSQTNSSPLWQSFDYPTHVVLPGNKFGYDRRTNKSQLLTSWKNSEDPASGRFSLELDPFGKQFIIRNGKSEQYWTSGNWNGEIFATVGNMRANLFYNFSYIENENGSYYTYHVFKPAIVSGFVMDIDGQIKQSTWSENTKRWILYWAEPSEICHVYALCGPFGICNRNSSRRCECPSGFSPSSVHDWNVDDHSGGCARKANLSCGINGTYSTKNEAKKIGFLTSYMDVSDDKLNSYLVKDANFGPFDSGKCRAACLEDCACNAYSFSTNRCWIWRDDILNLQFEGNSTMKMIYVKVASSNLPHIRKSGRKYMAGIVAGCIGLVLLLFCSIGLMYYKRVTRRDGVYRKQQNSGIGFYRSPASDSFMEDQSKMSEDDKRGIDVPFFEFKSILVATNNFSNANKLGQGGFGSVYKGNLPGGEDVAVKRLSSCSGQGEKEFKNEVLLIAKLQHRNLVRLLGYSMQQQEMILLYEYMPNKSLDCFIFDRTLCVLLDWTKRFDIILGIARGLVYLHQDSRLRIIHRDFKTSNILLDKDMNPKVSDFGLAKIVESRDPTEANTSRVVGTYGYMSPEYALDGFFSIKSDVFSFGVVVLEIISGKRNTRFIQHEESLSLLAYAWNLWAEEKPLELLDKALVQSCNSTDEVLKCIMIGLLCVQDDPDDRPTMTDVLLMLGATDIASLPKPQKPAFVSRKHLSTSHTFSYKSDIGSNVMSTITEVEGR